MQSSRSLRAWLRAHGAELDAIVFDIDGVLLHGPNPAPGSLEVMRDLHAVGLPFALLTNDGCHSPEEKAGFLIASGVPVTAADIVSCGHGLIELKARHGWEDGRLFYVLGSLGPPCYAETAGLGVTRDPAAVDGCTGVIIGEKSYDWAVAVTAAFNLFRRHPERFLIVPNPDDCYPGRDGQMGVASGAVGRMIERLCHSCGVRKTPVYLGKPYAPIFAYNHHRLERRLGRTVRRERVLIVGDSLTSDVPGGRDFGYRTALVMTGLTRPDMLAASEVKPDLVFEEL